MTIPFTSTFDSHKQVQLDPWAVNPLLDDSKQSVPELVKLAQAAQGNPPTMFVTGDAPPFLASGVDPRFLKVLPWRCRHAAAMESSSLTVLGWVEQYANDPDAVLPSPGLGEYVGRFRNWLNGKAATPGQEADPAAVAAAEDDFYNSMFGGMEAAQKAKLDALGAAAATFNAGRATRGFR